MRTKRLLRLVAVGRARSRRAAARSTTRPRGRARRSTPVRALVGRRSRGSRAVLTVLVAAGVLVSAPGPALANGNGGYPNNALSPFVDCYTAKDSSGGYGAVMGYANTTGATATEPYGYYNTWSPTQYQGSQPTTFSTGVHDAVFTVYVADPSTYPTWWLGSSKVVVGQYKAPTCSATQLPASGNDTGPVLALVVAGVVGALVLRRLSRTRTRSGSVVGS